MKNIPDKIYLQIGENADDVDFNDLYEITWADEPIFDNDIEYVNHELFNKFIDEHYSHSSESYKQELKDSFVNYLKKIDID
jgi:hypothetical protein